MILTWMLYTLLVGVLLAAAARCLEELARLASLPLRWIWLAALLGLVVLAALAPLRTSPAVGGPALGIDLAALAAEGVHGVESPAAPAPSVLRSVREAAAAPVDAALSLAGGAGNSANLAAGAVWGGISLLVLLIFLATARRWAVRRRRWTEREMAGARVRVSPSAGPAVVGVLRPEIVIPRWLTVASEEEQRLVVLHEKEHLRARDPAVLALGCLAVAAVPWHPAAWWMLLRLRLAVELDCDRRVLRRGVRPLAYGSVLIDVAGRGSGIALGAPALADTPSTLERRLSAMTSRLSRTGAVRAVALTIPAAALLFVACDAELPTTAEVEAMDVAAVEDQAQRFRIISSADGATVTYFLNGEEVDAEEARAVLGDRIARVEVLRPGEEGVAEIRIRTREEGAEGEPELRLRGERGDGEHRVRILGPEGEEREVRMIRPGEGPAIIAHRDGEGELSAGRFEGIIEIDGEITDQAAFRSLRPDQIESVEVLKGGAAARLFDDPAAAHGVIRIRTRDGVRD